MAYTTASQVSSSGFASGFASGVGSWKTWGAEATAEAVLGTHIGLMVMIYIYIYIMILYLYKLVSYSILLHLTMKLNFS